MIRVTLLAIVLSACCVPERQRTPIETPALPECASYRVVMMRDGDGATLTLKAPDGDVSAIAFWGGSMVGASDAVTGGGPRLVSCGPRCLRADGPLEGDVCAEALWRAQWTWVLDSK